MRGLLTIFFGRQLQAEEISTALVVCSADGLKCSEILTRVWSRFPKARLTYVAPREFVEFLPEGADIRLISGLKQTKLQHLREIRAQKHDVTVLMLTGQPIFRKLKLWALFTNYRMLVVYNENLDRISCSRSDPTVVIRHLKWRLTEKSFPRAAGILLKILLFPLGFVYLVLLTAWAILSSQLGQSRRVLNRE